MREFDTGDIRQFYDRHTPAFVALGQRGSHGAIHRAVWGPGATGHEQAFRYVENEIATLLRNLPPAFGSSTVVDLGCGVGASLLDRDELRSLARAAGFAHESTTDLSPYLELRRVRDRLAGVLLSLFRWLPVEGTRFGYVWGGSALQTCLERGWIGYDLARFRRVD